MCSATALVEAQCRAGAEMTRHAEAPTPLHFGDPLGEYKHLADGVGVVDRGYRGGIDITGQDRADWLHNLTTNHIKDVPTNQARYLFACNVKGRIIFDAVAGVLADRIVLDLDRRGVGLAIKHLDKYVISEDVTLADHSDSVARLALVGGGHHALLAGDGSGPVLTFKPMDIHGVEVGVLRHDFCGLPSAELFVPIESAVSVWQGLLDEGIKPVGLESVQWRRIETGVPWSGQEIDDQVLPAETGQVARAVSFDKGCYLGQEVVERMRAHGSLARKLVGLVGADASALCAGARLEHDGAAVGRVTSACVSPAMDRPIGLGYVRTALAKAGSKLTVHSDEGGQAEVEVAGLPFDVGR
ncbi:MAG: YgfZ/GcvT domain-containing protein [Phycisphaerae bacterium]